MLRADICGAAVRRSSASYTTEHSSGICRVGPEDDGRSIGYSGRRTIACKFPNLRRAGGRSIAIAQNADNAIAVAMIPRMAFSYLVVRRLPRRARCPPNEKPRPAFETGRGLSSFNSTKCGTLPRLLRANVRLVSKSKNT